MISKVCQKGLGLSIGPFADVARAFLGVLPPSWLLADPLKKKLTASRERAIVVSFPQTTGIAAAAVGGPSFEAASAAGRRPPLPSGPRSVTPSEPTSMSTLAILRYIRFQDILDILFLSIVTYHLYIWFRDTKAFRALVGLLGLGLIFTAARAWGLFLTT